MECFKTQKSTTKLYCKLLPSLMSSMTILLELFCFLNLQKLLPTHLGGWDAAPLPYPNPYDEPEWEPTLRPQLHPSASTSAASV
jgi:hypothetical protein